MTKYIISLIFLATTFFIISAFMISPVIGFSALITLVSLLILSVLAREEAFRRR